ncbi:hypothetical protein DsansV1_C03g0028671 [Dioscorea sansibarensis]
MATAMQTAGSAFLLSSPYKTTNVSNRLRLRLAPPPGSIAGSILVIRSEAGFVCGSDARA